MGKYTPRIKVDQVNHPPHYQLPGGREAIEITKHLDFCLGNVVKYCLRAGKKEGASEVEDLKKAGWYLAEAIKMREGPQAKEVSGLEIV